MKKAKILIIDDEPNTRTGLSEVIKEEGNIPYTASTAFKALNLVGKEHFDLILLDLVLPGMGGMELFKRIQEIDEDVPVIIITAYGAVDSAIKAIKDGAEDYLMKPIDVDRLDHVISETLEKAHLKKELKRGVYCKLDYEKYGFVGNTPDMQDIYNLIGIVAPKNISVLITGESGTGKELVADAIHYNSPRRDAAFVKLNCASLAPSIMESELFGHERGAFTGAISTRKGRFEFANKGTLFLDEISEMSLETQVKLLRIIQNREFQRVGGNRSINTDIRFIFASNADLQKKVKEGSFREDLYHRINVVLIRLPPLRERKLDIPLLAAQFLEKYTKEYNVSPKELSAEAMELLFSYHWPGNVRELENLIERCVVVVSDKTIRGGDIEKSIHRKKEEQIHICPGVKMKEIEEVAIRKTLEFTGGCVSKAAQMLGISSRKIFYMLRKM
jgi:DNA-binding NtrC family response regulator